MTQGTCQGPGVRKRGNSLGVSGEACFRQKEQKHGGSLPDVVRGVKQAPWLEVSIEGEEEGQLAEGLWGFVDHGESLRLLADETEIPHRCLSHRAT